MKREKYFLLPTSYLLLFNNVFYKGVPNRQKVVRLRATFEKVCTKNHVSYCKKSKLAFYTPFRCHPQQRCFLPDQDAEYTVFLSARIQSSRALRGLFFPMKKILKKGLTNRIYSAIISTCKSYHADRLYGIMKTGGVCDAETMLPLYPAADESPQNKISLNSGKSAA